ncbi:MAG TPA: PRC-barrel domain-containing protein [Xanthobacteraceae bacterium]|jgi:sporulation protein YlmC with PRC-barrel domain
MLKTLMLSAALSGLLASGALAQSSPPAMSSEAKGQATETKSPKFIQAQATDKWVFSKFKGTDVLGPDNTKVGSVTDLLFDKAGKIDGLIVGVGGFLGIGEKNVAIEMTAFDVVPYHGAAPSTTGSAKTATSPDDPTRVNLKVSWTKDELKAAPDFQYYRPPVQTSQRPGAPSTTGMAPRPAAPAPAMPRQ